VSEWYEENIEGDNELEECFKQLAIINFNLIDKRFAKQ
jgi:hypothetical protein